MSGWEIEIVWGNESLSLMFHTMKTVRRINSKENSLT